MAPPAALRTHFIGCGRLGVSVARLFATRGSIEPGQVLTRSLESARAAVDFIGAGEAVASIESLERADLVFIATPDADLARSAETLASAPIDLDGAVVVHTSGALGSDVLGVLREQGASVASVHPIRSFAVAEARDDLLEGTVCGAEGDAAALDVALPLFEQAGARTVRIESGAKTLYHAAAVLACNHVVGLVEASLQTYEAAGVDRATAMAALEGLVGGTVTNVFERGPAGALSGPIVRGEADIVARQRTALRAVSPALETIYALLAQQTLPLARRVAGTDADRLDAVERALEPAASAD